MYKRKQSSINNFFAKQPAVSDGRKSSSEGSVHFDKVATHSTSTASSESVPSQCYDLGELLKTSDNFSDGEKYRFLTTTSSPPILSTAKQDQRKFK